MNRTPGTERNAIDELLKFLSKPITNVNNLVPFYIEDCDDQESSSVDQEIV
jgi:hypothetical protein